MRKHRANIHREKNHHFDRLLEKKLTATDLVISYEIMSPQPDARQLLWTSSGIETKLAGDLLVIRSPLNLVASYLARIRNEITQAGRVRQSIDHLQGWLPATYAEYLSAASDSDTTAIFYDQWGADRAYRKKILDAVGLEAKHLELGDMTSAGGGSSFDRDQQVETISTAKRWTRYVDDPDFLRLAKSFLESEAAHPIKERFPDDFAALKNL